MAQEIYESLSEEDQIKISKFTHTLFDVLYKNEVEYTKSIYEKIGLVDEVITFLQYNANKAFMNLGLEPVFPDADINPIVESGLNTEAPTHDFFSTKGSSYVKPTNIEELSDDDFDDDDWG